METSIINLTKEKNLWNPFSPRTKRGEICDVFVCVDERQVANFSAENSLTHLSRLPTAAAQFRGHPSARQTRHLPEEELPRLHGEPVLQREQHHRPGKETQAADPQRGELTLSGVGEPAAASGQGGCGFRDAPFQLRKALL